MRVSDLPGATLAHRLRHEGIALGIGPIVTRLRSGIPAVAEDLGLLYGDYPLPEDDAFADFHVRLTPPPGVRRWFRPQVRFMIDGQPPFKPLPLSQAFPFFEWGLNWCVANHIHQYLILHAAVIAREGRAVIMPGIPGAGKSTLCAALVSRGWRLLSDEMALIDTRDGSLIPIPRPISLKDASIAILRAFAPEETIGRVWKDTRKGTVSHMRAPRDSVDRAGERALPAWVVAPQFQPGAATRLQEEPKAQMFMNLATNAFNYHVHGPIGFRLLADLIDRCGCHRFTYSRLDEAITVFDRLATADTPSTPPM